MSPVPRPGFSRTRFRRLVKPSHQPSSPNPAGLTVEYRFKDRASCDLLSQHRDPKGQRRDPEGQRRDPEGQRRDLQGQRCCPLIRTPLS